MNEQMSAVTGGHMEALRAARITAGTAVRAGSTPAASSIPFTHPHGARNIK